MKITWELITYTLIILSYGLLVGWLFRGEHDKAVENERGDMDRE